jgi:hypothetical protein
MEGMLVGAAIGGGTALLTGEDVLTGALIGGATAGITGGLTEGLSPEIVETGVGVGTPAATEAAVTSNIASAQNMLQPTLAPVGGITSEAGRGIATNAVNTAAAPGSTGFWQGANSALPTQAAAQGAVSDVVLPGAQQGIASAAAKPGLLTQAGDWYGSLSPMEKIGVGVGGTALLSSALAPSDVPELDDKYDGPLSKFKYDPNKFNATRITPNVYRPGYAQGGIAALAGGGYPMGMQDNTQYATPTQMPMSAEIISTGYEPATNPYSGEPVRMFGGGRTSTASPSMGSIAGNAGTISPSMGGIGLLGNALRNGLMGNRLSNFQPTRNVNAGRSAGSHVYKPKYAEGGIAGYNLGGYAAGGNPRLLKGPGDGMSDDIPASIANKQPARLADGEFVVPADVVSHLGNGSTDAGAKHLYKMMDNVRRARTGKKAQGKQIKSEKFLPK